MGMIGAALAVTMLLAVALSGSDEGSGLAIKSAKLASAKAAPSTAAALKLKRIEKVLKLFQPLLLPLAIGGAMWQSCSTAGENKGAREREGEGARE